MLIGEMRHLNVFTDPDEGLINISDDRFDVHPEACNTVELHPSQVGQLAEWLYLAKLELDDRPLREVKGASVWVDGDTIRIDGPVIEGQGDLDRVEIAPEDVDALIALLQVAKYQAMGRSKEPSTT